MILLCTKKMECHGYLASEQALFYYRAYLLLFLSTQEERLGKNPSTEDDLTNELLKGKKNRIYFENYCWESSQLNMCCQRSCVCHFSNLIG